LHPLDICINSGLSDEFLEPAAKNSTRFTCFFQAGSRIPSSDSPKIEKKISYTISYNMPMETAGNTHRDETREELLNEIREFEREREQLKEVLGKIGGKNFSRRDNWINVGFFILILVLFLIELTTEYLPRLISLQLGVLLVSVKIVFMIHSQQKVHHFQFWILNSIEYRMNDIAKRMRKIERGKSDKTK